MSQKTDLLIIYTYILLTILYDLHSNLISGLVYFVDLNNSICTFFMQINLFNYSLLDKKSTFHSALIKYFPSLFIL